MKKMIKSLGILSFIVIMITTSCTKIKDALNIDINLPPSEMNFTIPIISQTGTLTLPDVSFALNIDSIIKANNAQLAANNIKSVTLKSCTITMLDGDSSNNFSALQSMKVMLSSNANTTKTPLVEITNNPDVLSYELVFPNSTVNLKDYFQANSFTYTMSGTARKTTSKDIHCKATINYSMNVGL